MSHSEKKPRQCTVTTPLLRLLIYLGRLRGGSQRLLKLAALPQGHYIVSAAHQLPSDEHLQPQRSVLSADCRLGSTNKKTIALLLPLSSASAQRKTTVLTIDVLEQF